MQLLLEQIDPSEQTIVFCESKKKLTDTCEFLRQNGILSLPFSNDAKMSSQQRMTTLQLFRQGKLPVIVANHLASRSLDFFECAHVI